MKLEMALLIAVAIATVGCSERQQENTKRDVKEAARSAEREMDDAGTTTAVKTKLAADVRLSTLTSINVDSVGSTVTLSGHVPTAADKRKAEETAMSVSGVTKVVNNLEVKP
ncbi:BON domain-containing protein [Bryobacter aggregatus]|uniref:BON domain-containing protein n=1 Tax=Bryobacter aggregatus TaxID=360054 RepID=UPI00068EDA3E|nr:BON domain-containing protein [Bryobacter aggregatus]